MGQEDAEEILREANQSVNQALEALDKLWIPPEAKRDPGDAHS
jgi:hypothetical protein